MDFTGLDLNVSKSSNALARRVVVLDGRLVVATGRLVVFLDDVLLFLDGFLDEDTSLSKGSSASSLQNGVVQRHALMFEEPGSEMSFKVQSISAVKGLSMGPSRTLVGKHSLSTAENIKNWCFIQ